MIQSTKITSRWKIWLALLVAGATWHCHATTYYVATNGDDSAAGTNWETSLRTINSAVAKAQTNILNDVLVSNGTYNFAAIIRITNGIAVRAFNPAASATVVNGMGARRCFEMAHPNALLAGFTITNGVENYGGGVYFYSGTISNCVVAYNRANYSGGGIYIIGTGMVLNCSIIANTAGSDGAGGIMLGGINPYTNAIVRDCLIFSNSAPAYRGGGVRLIGGLVENCRISYNSASAYGGGAEFVTSAGGGHMRNCLLTHNTAPQGGAVMIYGPANFMDNCTIVSNTATVSNGGGVQNHGGGTDGNGGRMRNCIVWFNISPSGSNYYDRSGGGYWTNCCIGPSNPAYGTGNFGGDPFFVDKDTNNWRIAATSPCINRGVNVEWMNNASDLDGHSRIDPFSRIVDVGAYEFLPQGALFKSH